MKVEDWGKSLLMCNLKFLTSGVEALRRLEHSPASFWKSYEPPANQMF